MIGLVKAKPTRMDDKYMKLLSEIDYQALKRTVKGWNAQKLAEYGISSPPTSGWRKGLLREYEFHQLPAWHHAPSLEWDPYREMLNTKKLYQEKSGDYSY